jgi:hypothetical protein
VLLENEEGTAEGERLRKLADAKQHEMPNEEKALVGPSRRLSNSSAERQFQTSSGR